MKRLLLLGFCLLLVAPASARAGVYEVQACGNAESMSAFSPSTQLPPGLTVGIECPTVAGRKLSGLSVASTASNAVRGAGASWTITAPLGTSLRRLDVERAFQKWDPDWRTAVRTAEQDVLETCEIGGAQVSCGAGVEAGARAATYSGLRTRSISFQVECLALHECAGWTSPVQAWMAVYGATALVDDPAPPVVAPLSVGAGWRREVEPVVIAATDASGVKRLSLRAGGTTFFDRQASCDYTQMQPCPGSARETVAVDTAQLADGAYELRAVATDAADQAGEATSLLKVDRHAPEAPQGLAIARNPNGTMALTWTNPDQGTAAPIAAALYEVCNANGGNCSPGAASGDGIARLEAIGVPTGLHVVRVWLQDQAGNSDPTRAASVTIDPSAVGTTRGSDQRPPALDGGPAPPALRVKAARRRGSMLTVSGTIEKAATARLTVIVSRGRTGAALARARTNPTHGRWSARLKLPPTSRRMSAFYVTVVYAGQKAFSASTVQRRLTKKRKVPRRHRVVDEFDIERPRRG
jgi:hypothetical protein